MKIWDKLIKEVRREYGNIDACDYCGIDGWYQACLLRKAKLKIEEMEEEKKQNPSVKIKG